MCKKFLPENLPLIQTFEQTIKTLEQKEQTLTQKFVSNQIALHSDRTGSAMFGPQSARNQIVRTSFQAINKYQQLDDPSDKQSKVN